MIRLFACGCTRTTQPFKDAREIKVNTQCANCAAALVKKIKVGDSLDDMFETLDKIARPKAVSGGSSHGETGRRKGLKIPRP